MLRKMSFFIRIFLCLAAVIATAMTVPLYYFSVSFQENLLEETKKQAFEKLQIASLFFELDPWKEGQSSSLSSSFSQEDYQGLEEKLAGQNLRLTLIKKNGDVIYDSSLDSKDISLMDNHADRPEFREAMNREKGFSLRYSNTLNIDFIYVATLLENDYALRLAFPYDNFEKRMSSMLRTIAFAFALGIFLALILAFIFSYGIKRQLKRMLDVIELISLGKYSSRLHYVPGKEFAVLAHAVNRMAENIENQLDIMREQSVQLEGIFNTMQDGIFLLDAHGNVRHTNKALRELCPQLPDQDRMPEDFKIQIIECIASPLLQNTVDKMLKVQKTSQAYKISQSLQGSQILQSEEPQGINSFEAGAENKHYIELELFSGRHFAFYLAKPESPTEQMGLVIVVHEITELMHLEKIRKDFVANVSHELRTPLTAIQGYAETIESMSELSTDCRKFAQIIHKHGSYLSVMIEDLLALARIENEKESFVLSPVLALDAFNTAASFCHNALQNNNLKLSVDISDSIMVQANQPYLERVFRNLLENACRYALPESDILVFAKTNKNKCEFTIENKGVYIPPEHIERIFERFYRVEKDRSSKANNFGEYAPNLLGTPNALNTSSRQNTQNTQNTQNAGASTGLGLAICKHIIERHGGVIRAESTNHKTYGISSFIFTLSLADAQLDNEENHER